MFEALEGLSLRTKITASFVLIVVFGTALSTLVGSRIVTGAVLEQARNRVRHGLETAQLVYSTRQAELCRSVEQAAASSQFGGIAGSPQGRDVLQRAALQVGIDFFVAFDPSGEPLTTSPTSSPALPLPVTRALEGEVVSGTERVPREFLEIADPRLARRLDGGDETRGIVMLCAAPLRRESRADGALAGGIVINENVEIVEQIRDLVFGGETYRDRTVGTVAVFAEGSPVAGLGAGEAGTAVEDSRIPAGGLGAGATWFGRTSPGSDPYLFAFAPLQTSAGATVAVLGVGILEAPFLAVRTDMMLSFLVVMMLAIVVLLGLTYLITRNTIRPLEEMAAATRKISEGDLDTRVRVRAGDEIGQLAGSFNLMLESLAKMKRELEQWGQTLEEKVKIRTEELAAVQAQMLQSEKMASLGRMAAGVAHELNNPLGGILSLSMLALEEIPGDDPVREDVETISKQAMRCREIVKGLLDFSRRTQRSAVLTDVTSVVEATLSLLEKQAAFHDIEISREIHGDLPQVHIDPGQLQQVVMNLLLNAVDAMDQHGTMEIVCERARIVEEILIGVTDNGKGIPNDVLPYLFEPFFTTKRVGQGTGLGLSIVHGIVTRAGGRIQVESRPGRTTFTVRLPIAVKDEPGEPQTDADRRAGQPSLGR